MLMACCLLGCASTPDPTRKDIATAEKLASDQGPAANLKPYYQRLYFEGESQATLNQMRLAFAAMEQAEWKDAGRALDEVIRDIEALGPADPRSREALSHFESEDIKKFKGETHERAMAYLLRGLLYLKEKDLQNARACFKSVQIQDAAKNDPSLQGNWASADWLEGWCNWNLGERSAAQQCWDRSNQRLSTRNRLPRPSETDNAVCIALLGFGPVKIPKGDHGELLSYREGASRTARVKLKIKEVFKAIPMVEDLFVQASSRGRRLMDQVNEEKADVRSGTETAGDVFITGGMGTTIGGVVADDTDVAVIGLGVTAAGAVTKGIASSIKPKADTRTWDLLPARIHILPFTLPTDANSLEFQLLDEQGGRSGERKVQISHSAPPEIILLIER